MLSEHRDLPVVSGPFGTPVVATGCVKKSKTAPCASQGNRTADKEKKKAKTKENKTASGTRGPLPREPRADSGSVFLQPEVATKEDQIDRLLAASWCLERTQVNIIITNI